uniref:Tail protein n=1 Tax=viral metagenome TaxID=1070528 RepID=A0A6M3L8C5_9ZZZZ
MGSGLKTRLQTITDIKHVWAPNELPDAVNEFPAALILPGETAYHETFGNQEGVNFRVIILMHKGNQPSALNRVLDYIDKSGSDSVYAAVDGDSTLGGAADWAVVDSNNGISQTQWGGQLYLSTEFAVRCSKA